MSEGPKRFSLSDYQSKRGHAKPAEAAVLNDQKTELEELHMLLRTGDLGKVEHTGAEAEADNSGAGKKRGRNVALRAPGASPDDGYEDEEGEDVEMAEGKNSSKRDRGSSRRGDKRESRDRDRDRDRDREGRRRRRSSSRHRHHRHHHKSSRRSKRSRSRSRSPSPTKHRRSKGRSVSPSRSRTRGRSDQDESRSRSRTGRSQRTSRKRESRRSRSQSPSRDKISMRCVFPYEDGGIIIGLRGAHLTKLRRAMPDVDWRISNETNDRQDRILVIKGTAFKELAEHFISQGMHVEYPPQTRGRGNEDVDVAKPFVPMRLLIPHKTCGAIIGQKSETLINTRISCGARRVYVYRERIANSRERVVEIVGTPASIAKVMMVLGEQVGRTLTSDQQESDPYSPERDGLRQFLSKQGVPRTRVNLEPIKPPGTAGDKDEENVESRKGGGASSSKRRSADRSISRSPSSERSRSRSRSRSRDQERSRRGKHRSNRRPRSRSRSVSPSRRSSRRSSKRKDSTKPQSSKRDETRHKGRADSRSRSRSESGSSDSSSSGSDSDSSYVSGNNSRSVSSSRSRSRAKRSDIRRSDVRRPNGTGSKPRSKRQDGPADAEMADDASSNAQQ
ncbi:RNA binding protein, heterogenous nuclear RNP-K like protein, partial [Coemansia furcata]